MPEMFKIERGVNFTCLSFITLVGQTVESSLMLQDCELDLSGFTKEKLLSVLKGTNLEKIALIDCIVLKSSSYALIRAVDELGITVIVDSYKGDILGSLSLSVTPEVEAEAEAEEKMSAACEPGCERGHYYRFG
ncbi:MAG: hypothetical protein HOI53_03280 [Francisellaceae bacterium]|jgi:hypothetical protein|nr:hypothetical protein [Francisellaceae bacterium]MBT6207025.1 hypothetical protein [Francisellaceae bacterium]MBT6538244.1 hypothetical protein [Francisellaceae bacterium]